ncbi:MAG: DNA repair protein RecO [Candidatus Pacebacteria bacterium]|jgi:DNA repair protein RecO (recombination protein O)|nr:DNA repair protein RecO [bacterium]MDP6527397.1 DNA repair protein RecO [Candidatus Paceibacterota bacterium]MDP6659523.1 DNA repair protein RecO [Candidatus Paceibacterota bacterium]|tara:strand:- start:26486 stop:27079 length:594 start_codon:yes stop_codon:yes gene_type:complete
MSYQLYKTEGIVLACLDKGEAHRQYDLLTEELGFVRAVARSVRENKSKLRYSLQNFSVSSISLVRGKEIWRITGASEVFNIYHSLKESRERQQSIGRIISLVRRLVHGEGENSELYRIVLNAVLFLKSAPDEIFKDDRFEILTVLRILYNLGYLAKKPPYEELLNSIDLDKELVTSVSPVRKDLINTINSSLSESHL